MHPSHEMLKPETFFPVAKDATLGRAAQLACLGTTTRLYVANAT